MRGEPSGRRLRAEPEPERTGETADQKPGPGTDAADEQAPAGARSALAWTAGMAIARQLLSLWGFLHLTHARAAAPLRPSSCYAIRRCGFRQPPRGTAR